ncbi:ABC-type multidrug transport system ATPase subunit [Streptomyces candidus]|uniref:ABC-type multidrug transport system ATPase subunit n=1 Tax=Streptomyces candidus TaxID=67283 RepID=A0A7X0LQ34_9ACTN|nr:ABC-type multidrug transport system ATPase subunit [Streptomyces candidus]GHH50786.1 hypothetical protein GCM10018773_48300 [Streptomyces candidus]
MSSHPHAQPHHASLTCTALSFSWPDGTPVLADFQLAVGPGRTGLIGVNGSGKSTLLKLLAGELVPNEGTVKAAGSVGHLPQNLVLDTGLRVDEALEIAGTRAALQAIEAGDPSEENFAAVGDDGDVEERARATLDALGLGHIALDRTIGEVSGGEGVLLRLAALLLRRPDVLLLDEPTNNLDLYARQRLYEAVSAYSEVLVVVSHDRELLERVDRIADLRDGEVRWYGGDVLKTGDTVYVGRGGRTNGEGVRRLRVVLEPLGARVSAVPVSGLLHLKSAVTALPDGTVVGYEPLVDIPAAFRRFLPVPEEAGAHVVVLDGNAVLRAASAPKSAELFAELGLTPVPGTSASSKSWRAA